MMSRLLATFGFVTLMVGLASAQDKPSTQGKPSAEAAIKEAIDVANDDPTTGSTDESAAADRQHDGLQAARRRLSVLHGRSSADRWIVDHRYVDDNVGADRLGDRSLHGARDR